MADNEKPHNPNFNNFCKEEVLLYDKIIDEFEWEVKDDGTLINGFFPIVVSNKKLIRLSMNLRKLPPNCITFKPLKNSKHCQLMLDFINMNPDSEEEIEIVTGKKNDYYYAELTSSGSRINIKKAATETEAKFKALLWYIFRKPNQEDELEENKLLLKTVLKFDKENQE